MLAQNRSTTTPISPEYSIDASQPPHNKLLAQPATSLSLSLGLHLESNVRLSFSSRSSHFRCGISPNAASLFDPQQSNRIAAPSWDTIVSCSSGEGASVEQNRVVRTFRRNAFNVRGPRFIYLLSLLTLPPLTSSGTLPNLRRTCPK